VERATRNGRNVHRTRHLQAESELSMLTMCNVEGARHPHGQVIERGYDVGGVIESWWHLYNDQQGVGQGERTRRGQRRTSAGMPRAEKRLQAEPVFAAVAEPTRVHHAWLANAVAGLSSAPYMQPARLGGTNIYWQYSADAGGALAWITGMTLAGPR
jgi:hypothetical protein